jgi:hypothetical protein
MSGEAGPRPRGHNSRPARFKRGAGFQGACSTVEVARLVVSRRLSDSVKVFTLRLKEVRCTCLTRLPGSGCSKAKGDTRAEVTGGGGYSGVQPAKSWPGKLSGRSCMLRAMFGVALQCEERNGVMCSPRKGSGAGAATARGNSSEGGAVPRTPTTALSCWGSPRAAG